MGRWFPGGWNKPTGLSLVVDDELILSAYKWLSEIYIINACRSKQKIEEFWKSSETVPKDPRSVEDKRRRTTTKQDLWDLQFSSVISFWLFSQFADITSRYIFRLVPLGNQILLASVWEKQ